MQDLISAVCFSVFLEMLISNQGIIDSNGTLQKGRKTTLGVVKNRSRLEIK